MRIVILFVFIASIEKQFTKTENAPEPPINIQTRIELLKREILEEIQDKQKSPRAGLLSDYYSDMYEYVNNDDQPITPIMEFDKRKLQDRFKLPEIISTTTEKYVPSDNDHSDTEKPVPRRKPLFKLVKKSHKPKEIFYRKMILDDTERNKPQKWTHCIELLTPLLKGYMADKSDMAPKDVPVHDGTVVRLAQLLSINVTNHNKDDIKSILYQISNLKLRVFQWDVNAVTTILNVIIKDKATHDFKSLKRGLKDIFRSWKLDLSDIKTFLKQSRIFRPPCIKVSELDGSTMSPKVLRYTKPTTAKDSSDADC